VRRFLPVVAGLLALAAGEAGFRLVPDTALYARRGLHVWPSPLGGLAGSVFGIAGVIVLSAIAVTACVQLVPRRRRLRFVVICAYWFAFPGVDALGLVFVLAAQRCRSSAARAVLVTVAGLVHPVAALTSFPIVLKRQRLALAAVAIATAAAIVGVGLYDGWTTTDRYALPLVGLLLARQ
jgi:hypothetical protein